MQPLRNLFLTMAVVFVVSVVAMYAASLAVLDMNQKVVRAQNTIDGLEDILSTMKDAETGQRGFLLTGKPPYLDPYSSAIARVGDGLKALDHWTQTGDLPADEVRNVATLARQKLAELSRTLQLRQTSGLDAAVQLVDTDQGKRTMDALRVAVGKLQLEKTEQQKHLRHVAEEMSLLQAILFIAIGLVDLAVLFWAFKQVRQAIGQRDIASNELRQQKELLSVTLASIGDGVIVTDTQAKVTFLNAEAQKLTGWSSQDAQGQPCEKVFNIINEDSRQRVESPVEKVLRLGTIVGLANHTLLIRKDGSEIPIDDSGAPIRNTQGAIHGVVLVFRDFSEHKASEKQLRTAKEEAEAANVAKDNFLATLSHELRTPLSPVLATLGIWESGEELPAALLSDVQTMRRNVELEARLIDDLLDLTRIVKGKLPLNLETADVHALIEAVTSMYQSDIRAKRLRLSLKLDAEKHHVTGDPARLQQVFWNILKNATKFTPEGGEIHVRSTNDPQGRVHLSFIDTGIGMTDETISRLFHPFEQGSAEMVRQYGGLGLGMAISRALVEAHAGEIQAKSQGRGQGSTFTVTMHNVTAPAPVPTPPRSVDGRETPKKLRIVLVEDHPDTARVMTRLLQRMGHEVKTANSVASGVEAAQQPFDLLLSDIGLPDGTGVELVQKIRALHGKEFKAVALTGFGMEEDVRKCKAAGFDEHLTKPVSIQQLELVMQRTTAAV
jgi:PAS domain S-box-containing protein